MKTVASHRNVFIFEQANRITKIENLSALSNLEELYSSENGITVIEGFENNLKLTTLDLAYNKITNIPNLSHLKDLEDLWVPEIDNSSTALWGGFYS